MIKNQILSLQQALEVEINARKLAEKKLAGKSLRLLNTTKELQGIFENSNDTYVVINLNGDVLKINGAESHFFGYNYREEGLNILKLIYKEDYDYAMQSFQNLIQKGVFENYTARIVTKTKQLKWVHINASIVYDLQKKPIAAQGIVRDITAIKEASSLLEEQEKKLSIIVDNSPFAIGLTQDQNFIKVNDVFQKLLGYSEKEMMHLTVNDISFSGQHQPKTKKLLAKMASGEIDNFIIEKRYKKKDGSLLWAKTKISVVRDAKGKVKYHIAIIEDAVLEREKALVIDVINDIAKSILGKMNLYEIAWEISQKIGKYLRSNDCVIYLFDEESQNFERISSFQKKIKNKSETKPKITYKLHKGIVGSVAKTGIAEIINDTSKDSRYIIDGVKRLSEITVPILNKGKVIGIINAEHQDKNAFTKENLETLQNVASLVAMHLQNAINLREREKAEKENIQLLQKLEKSHEDLQEYAHVISHDLKSPLHKLYALVSWIKEDTKETLDFTSLQNLEHIETTLERMELLITDVLNYSSLGVDITEKESVNIQDIVINLENILHIPEHISMKTLKELPTISGSKIKLQQLFQNILSNAIKFCDKTKGIITINVKEQQTHYQFSIQDNGIGIEKKYHKKIFNIFNTLNKTEGSTGIGLSIVKKIVNQHNGKIWIESELTKGSTFFFTLKK